jgi:hypothetical protein
VARIQTHATQRLAVGSAIYGVVSVAVVIVAWEGDGDRWDLVQLLAGYLAALWLTHVYAVVVSEGMDSSWTEALRLELPVAAAGVPALAASLVGALVKWDVETTSDVALLACAATLLALQAAVLRGSRARMQHLVATVVINLLCGGMIVFLHISVH